MLERGSIVQAVWCVSKGSTSSWAHLDHRNKSGASRRLLRLNLVAPGYSDTLVKIHTFVVIRCVRVGSVGSDRQEFVTCQRMVPFHVARFVSCDHRW